MSSVNVITKVIHTFSELLQIEIAFFNHEGVLTASTEEYRKRKGNRVHLPFFRKLYKHPISFLHKPGHMKMCQGCHFQKNCPSTVEIVRNIVEDEKHYGYLAFVSFSTDGEERLMESQKEYSHWMSQLSDVIMNILHELGDFKLISKKETEKTDYILGNSETLHDLKELMKSLVNSTSSIIITGETGTGKSLLAKMLHERSIFRQGNFVEINCASIPESLFESELFGYEEGAFTGARKTGKPGYFELADRGTLFLDEIADLPLQMQPKLLKVLQDGVVQRIGGTVSKEVNVRVIAAANQSLEQLMESKQFRSDLYYRLNVIPIHLPPLRERKEDIDEIVPVLIEKLQTRTGKFIQTCDKEFLRRLKQHHWPGNIRELENVLEYSMNMEKSAQLSVSSLPPSLKKLEATNHSLQKEKRAFKEMEREVLIQKLNQYGYDHEGKKLVAEDLGVSVRTIYRKIDKLQIPVSAK
ncbi:sigma-54 interaction domain-containing protein [Pseudobacillus wudalianchiensis]|uniref:Fis family transcriptional regulator n=1 Tax=Pseudobacillus wudalianchiensis TaxID=1743143 RepID=A0A1B9BA21_9BACI|nr:sigma 54-interacting transcriptional regulator [Bacillus wudalianchiensis]OCA92923.1 Fis family transcriptional regulator [Bacillus wudalianchiensis]